MTPAQQKELNRQFVKAAGKGDVGRLERLLSEGAELEAMASISWRGKPLTALGAASSVYGREVIPFLLARGADINRQDGDGMTALMHAVRKDFYYTIELLLDNGARTDLVNNEGKTALAMSIQMETSGNSDLLRKHIAVREEKEKQRQREAEYAAQRAKEREQERQKALVEKPVVAAPVVPPQPEPKKEDPDIVIFRQKAGDRLLEDVFNFVSFERVTFVRRDVGAPVEAMTRQGFSDVENRDYLRKAFTEHVKRGGAVKEEDIFIETKAKISKLQGATTP